MNVFLTIQYSIMYLYTLYGYTHHMCMYTFYLDMWR